MHFQFGFLRISFIMVGLLILFWAFWAFLFSFGLFLYYQFWIVVSLCVHYITFWPTAAFGSLYPCAYINDLFGPWWSSWLRSVPPPSSTLLDFSDFPPLLSLPVMPPLLWFAHAYSMLFYSFFRWSLFIFWSSRTSDSKESLFCGLCSSFFLSCVVHWFHQSYFF